MLWGQQKPYRLFGIICLSIATTTAGKIVQPSPETPWVHTYVKKLSPEEQQELVTHTRAQLMEAEQIPPFNQLIFSWNAHKGDRGYLLFSIQPHLKETETWSAYWYPMGSWGADQCRSFRTENLDDQMAYNYVHLDGINKHYANGFRIKVEAFDGAHLENLHAIHICTCDFEKFQRETVGPQHKKLASISIANVPAYSQFEIPDEKNKVMCSPTSTCMLASFLLKKPLDPYIFAKQAYDPGLNAYGSWPFNTATAFENDPAYLFYVARLNSFFELYKILAQGIPVVISVKGTLPGAVKEFTDGHLILIVGWDKKKQMVLCHDPAFCPAAKVPHAYPLIDIVRAWENSYRTAYIARPTAGL
jgi:hypothetical protein